jgi:peroxiredoxin
MEKSDSNIGSYAPDFELPGTDGQVHHLARYVGQYQAIAVVFIANQCPSVCAYLERLKAIQQDFSDRGVTLIAINANDSKKSPQDGIEEMKEFAMQHDLNFPYLRDPTQDVALGFGVETTPQVFLLDKSSKICYRGQIDDHLESPTVSYLRESIEALLKGETIKQKETEAIGSPVKWRDG